ncbi:MAG: OB-fold nucleic acid binding domain-containing protein, partial [Candidatus Binatia bacterium]
MMPDKEDTYLEDDTEQVEVRRQKLAKLKEAGHRAYVNDFKPTHTIAAINGRFSNATEQELSAAQKDLRIAGRIMSVRRMGKASFFHMQDRRGRLQVYVQQNQVGEKA